MASLVAGGLLASRALFKYNRKNFMFDKKLRQEREFQEQDMRLEQFSLYREDVRDLVELTVGKMDLYLVSSALLIDRTTVMITKANEALPPGSPGWAVALNAMSLASGVFYLLLCLWLAMYASVSAQSFGTRLLTQFVRLPIASQAHVGKSTATAVNYEERGLNEFLRVPVVQAGAGRQNGQTAAMAHASQPAVEGDGASPTGRFRAASSGNFANFIGNPVAQSSMLPTAMLDHIRLYRRVQLNWQAYDAYARVSLFCGANSLLYSCLYWSLGSFLQQGAYYAALGVALIFATIQGMLTKLDLHLRRKDMNRIGVLLAATPLITTLGMVGFENQQHTKGSELVVLRVVVKACAIISHALHTVVASLVLRASWPDSASDEEALLPGKFRSTLYLDVFGWLLNPTGPGPGSRRQEEDLEDDDDDSRSVASTHRSRLTTEDSEDPSGDISPRSIPSPVSPRQGRVRFREDSSDVQASASPEQLSASPESPQRLSAAAVPTTLNARHRHGSDDSASSASSSTLPSRLSRQSFRHASLPVVSTRSSRRSFRHFTAANLPVVGDRANRDRLRAATVDFSREVRREARRLLSPSSGSMIFEPTQTQGAQGVAPAREVSGTQEEHYGGREALPLRVMEDVSAPGTATAATFMHENDAPRRVHSKTELPGQTPWSAFFRGTLVIVITWAASTLWTVERAISSNWAPDYGPHGPHAPADETPQLLTLDLEPRSSDSPLWRALCQAGSQESAEQLSQVSMRHWRRLGSGWTAPEVWRDKVLLDGGCGMYRPSLDLFLACNYSNSCVAALLRRGGRSITLCRVKQQGRTLVLSSMAKLHLMSGAPALQSIAVHWRAGASVANITQLQFIGRAENSNAGPSSASGSLLAFRVIQHSGLRLMPEFEVELASQAPAGVNNERLIITGGALLSLVPTDEVLAAQQNSCPARGLQLRTWDLGTGERATHWLPGAAAPLARGLGASDARPAANMALQFLAGALCPK